MELRLPSLSTPPPLRRRLLRRMAAALPTSGGGIRRLNPTPWLLKVRSSASSPHLPAAEPAQRRPSPPSFPKKNQTLELVCESLAFKGKGVCKVADTGFVVMCDRALPGERFVGRVTRKRGNYAEVGLVFETDCFFVPRFESFGCGCWECR